MFKLTDSDDGFSFVCNTLSYGLKSPLNFLVLCDISALSPPGSRAKWTCIFSSPNPVRFKEIIKNKPTRSYTLPTWNELELHFLGSNIADWYDAFALYGGVPRHIFGTASDFKQPLDKALLFKGAKSADSFFNFGFGGPDPDQSYVLVHINPPRTESGSYIYHGTPVYSFASEAILQTFVELNTNKMFAKAIHLFNRGKPSAVLGAGTAGICFEQLCLWLCPLQGKRMVASPLPKPSVGTALYFHVPSTRAMLSYDWKRTKSLEANLFYVPRVTNLTSADAFYLVEGAESGEYTLVVLQITVAESHPVKAQGLLDIILAFPEKFKITSKALVFVVNPSCLMQDAQKLTNLKGEELEEGSIRLSLRDFKQYIVRYKLSEPGGRLRLLHSLSILRIYIYICTCINIFYLLFDGKARYVPSRMLPLGVRLHLRQIQPWVCILSEFPSIK
jgi:hypothetical protein